MFSYDIRIIRTFFPYKKGKEDTEESRSAGSAKRHSKRRDKEMLEIRQKIRFVKVEREETKKFKKDTMDTGQWYNAQRGRLEQSCLAPCR